jgi:hypothetical protein
VRPSALSTGQKAPAKGMGAHHGASFTQEYCTHILCPFHTPSQILGSVVAPATPHTRRLDPLAFHDATAGRRCIFAGHVLVVPEAWKSYRVSIFSTCYGEGSGGSREP